MSKDRIIEILEDKLQHQNRIILQFSDTLSTQSDTIKRNPPMKYIFQSLN